MSKQDAAQRSLTEWDKLVDEWRLSGQTQEAFAVLHGINFRTFQGHVWKSKKRRGLVEKETACRFVEVSSPSDELERSGECRITITKTEFAFTSSVEGELVFEILSKLGCSK